MRKEYPGIYSDQIGTEAVIILNDGQELSLTVRGVEFVGSDFDRLEPTVDVLDPSYAPLTLNQWGQQRAGLCDYVIVWDMRLPVIVGDAVAEGVLHAHLELSARGERGRLDGETLRLTLDIGGASYVSGGKSDWFEDELVTLQEALPDGIYLKACFSCAFSDYSVYGHGLFGNMLCFRNQKAAYLAARSKDGYINIMDGFTEMVQETYLCPDFEQRTPGTGYRG